MEKSLAIILIDVAVFFSEGGGGQKDPLEC